MGQTGRTYPVTSRPTYSRPKGTILSRPVTRMDI